MKHKCDENKLILIEENGTLITYKCPVCGKKFYELGSIVIPSEEILLKCRIYINWSNKTSLVKQVHNLKKLIPSLKNINNKELLDSAKHGERLAVGEMYLKEAEELMNIGKTYDVNLEIEEL